MHCECTRHNNNISYTRIYSKYILKWNALPLSSSASPSASASAIRKHSNGSRSTVHLSFNWFLNKYQCIVIIIKIIIIIFTRKISQNLLSSCGYWWNNNNITSFFHCLHTIFYWFIVSFSFAVVHFKQWMLLTEWKRAAREWNFQPVRHQSNIELDWFALSMRSNISISCVWYQRWMQFCMAAAIRIEWRTT